MKNFLRFCFVNFTVLVVIFVAVLFASPKILERPTKHLLERFTSNNTITTNIDNITILYDKILIKNLVIHNTNSEDDFELNIGNITIDYDILKSIKKLGFYFTLNISDFSINDIKMNLEGVFVIKESLTKITDFKIDFGQKSYANFSLIYKKFLGNPYHIEANGEILDMPLMIHKAFWNILPDNKIVQFLRSFILEGKISGSFYVNLDKHFFSNKILDPQNIDGKFDIKSLSLKYDESFPVITDINSNLVLNGTNINFNISSANSAEILIKDSMVSIDWGKGDFADVICKIKGKGSAVGLIKFIPLANVEQMQKYDIDLTKIKGLATIDVATVIPLKPGTINQYNVDAKISNVSLNIFDSNIIATNGIITGKFDGEKVIISGPIKINGFNSDVNYQMNLDDSLKNDFEHSLDIKMKLLPNHSESKNWGITINHGSAIANINYKIKSDSSVLLINSNLKNLDFLIDKVGLYKPQGIKSSIEISGKSDNSSIPSNLKISLVGDGGIKIDGIVDISQDSKKITLQTVKYGDTDLKANFILGHNSLKAYVSGSSLDLSKANMMRFLDKEADSRETELDINIKTIRMKNDIWLDDFLLNISCDKVRCYRGMMDSKIGTRSFKMNLDSTASEAEEWKISTTNAGAILRAVGIYNKMLAGNMILNIHTNRKQVKAGEPISIINGEFNLNKFVITDMPFLSRMISFTSLKGIMPFRNNNRVNFVKMNGAFGYKDGIISVARSLCEGQNFNFTMEGSINSNTKTYKLKGFVIPSIYGFNSFIRKIPVIGNIISAPYFIKDSY